MQICPECGTRNAAGAEFCAGCGAFLAWEDEQSPARTGSSAPPPQRPPAPPPREDSAPPPTPSRVVRTSNRVTPMPSSPPGPSRPAPPPPAPPPPAAPPPSPATPSTMRPPDGTEKVTSSRVQGPGSLPPSRELGSVPPGDTQAPPPRPRDPEADGPGPGEIVCPRCGTGNARDRHFCRRCAMELRRVAPAPAPPPPPPRRRRSPAVWVLAALTALIVLWLLIQL